MGGHCAGHHSYDFTLQLEDEDGHRLPCPIGDAALVIRVRASHYYIQQSAEIITLTWSCEAQI